MVRTRAIWCACLFLVAAILTPAFANASDSKEAAPADPTGTWKWERKFNDNTAQFSLKLNWDGERLRGKYSAFDQTSDIEEAKLEKDQISFLAKREFNGNRFEVKFNGKVEPDDLVGKITVDFGNGPQDFDWDAKRAVEPGDVVGVWNLQLKSPEGATDTAITPKLTVTKSADGKLQGHSDSQVGSFEAKNMMLKDNVLTWEIAGDSAGRQVKIVYKGKPRGNTIAGENEYDFGGAKGTMKFTGKRTPPEEKKDSRSPDGQEPKRESNSEEKTKP